MGESSASGFYAKAYGLKEEDTQQYYADWASTYDAELVDGGGYAMPSRCRQAVMRHVSDRDTSVADLGCGTGLLAAALKTAGYTVIDGFDYSPGMLREAAKTGAYRTLVSTDLNKHLDKPDASYGAVVAMGIFTFGHVRADALDEMHRILEPGGILVIGVNEKFVEEGSLSTKLDAMVAAGELEMLEQEYGDHMPGSDVNGWVYVARRNQVQPP